MRREWTALEIENLFAQYRAIRLRVEQMQQDINALRELLADDGASIEGGTFRRAQDAGLPRGGSVPKPTERLAIILPDAQEREALVRDLRHERRVLDRLNSWLAFLPERERVVMDMFYVRGMTWAELTGAYNRNALDGGRSESSLRGVKREALNRITNMLNSQI